MKAKQAMTLVLVLAVLAGATALVLRLKQPPPPAEGLLGRPLLADLSWQDVAAVTIRGPEGTVGLAEQDGRWVVLERGGYPADFSRIAALVKDLRDASIGRVFEPDQESLGRLGLKDPDDAMAPAAEAATLLVLMDEQGEKLAEITLGMNNPSDREPASGSGRYVRLSRKSTVYRVDKSLAFSGAPADWLDKRLLQIRSVDIGEIVCRGVEDGRVRYRLKRSEPGVSFTLEGPKADLSGSPEKIRRLGDAVSSLQMLDLEGAPGSEGAEVYGVSFPVRIEYRLFNGMVYRIDAGAACRGEKGCPLQVSVTLEDPDGSESGEAESGSEAGPPEDPPPEDPSTRAASEAARLEGRVFFVPEWQYAGFAMEVGDLLEEQDEKAASGPR